MDEKVKNSPKQNRIYFGCLYLLAIPFTCFIALFIFARWGGEWAASGLLPIRDNSIHITSVYEESHYIYKTSLFINPSPAIEIRDWFNQYAAMTPVWVKTDEDGNKIYLEQDDYYHAMWPGAKETEIYSLHRLSAIFTASWFDDMQTSCNGVTVYKNHVTYVEFAAYEIPEGYTAFEVKTCWPNA